MSICKIYEIKNKKSICSVKFKKSYKITSWLKNKHFTIYKVQIKNLSPADILSSVDFNAAVVSNLVNLDKYWILNFCDNIWGNYSETNSPQSISVKTFNISGSSSNSEIKELILYFEDLFLLGPPHLGGRGPLKLPLSVGQ